MNTLIACSIFINGAGRRRSRCEEVFGEVAWEKGAAYIGPVSIATVALGLEFLTVFNYLRTGQLLDAEQCCGEVAHVSERRGDAGDRMELCGERLSFLCRSRFFFFFFPEK